MQRANDEVVSARGANARAGDPMEMRSEGVGDGSVNVVRIGPSRETGYDVEFSKKLGDHQIGVVFRG